MGKIRFSEYLQRWKLDDLSIGPDFLQAKIRFSQADRQAAWELYVEMLTRITTQPLPAGVGDEATALKSVYSLFDISRQALKSAGPDAIQVARLMIPVLNQVVRPFTARWHGLSLAGAFDQAEQRAAFREELRALQERLLRFQAALADIAQVEDISVIGEPGAEPQAPEEEAEDSEGSEEETGDQDSEG
jgi:hypothetical protein